MRITPTVPYEAMFLLSQSVAADLAGAVGHIKETITRYGGEIVALKKWADRPLAYPINKQKRGTYILCYFNCPTDRIGEIERGFNLSEMVLRQLIIRCDHLSQEEMKNADGQLDLTIEANLRGHGGPGQTGAGAGQPGVAAAPAAPAPAAAVSGGTPN